VADVAGAKSSGIEGEMKTVVNGELLRAPLVGAKPEIESGRYFSTSQAGLNMTYVQYMNTAAMLSTAL
jgi:hypothetical protein